MKKTDKSFKRLILIFSLSFLAAFAIIKVRNIFIGKQVAPENNLKKNDTAVFPDLPVPEGAKSVFPAAEKKYKKGYIYQCSQSLEKIAEFYRSSLTAQNWQEDKSSAKTLSQATGMRSLVFTRKGFICFLELKKLQKDKGIAVVIQVLRSGN